MNWKHASFALAIFTGLGLFFGCGKHRQSEGPQCYELSVAWADGTSCADAAVRWLGQGDWNGQWSEGFEEIPLSPFLPVDARGRQTWCRPADARRLHALEVRLQSDTTIAVHTHVTTIEQSSIQAVLPKPVLVRLLPGKAFPSGWIGTSTPVWADSAGWLTLGSVNWTSQGSWLRFVTSVPSLDIWMDLPANETSESPRRHWQLELSENGPWPDSLDWAISVH